MSLENWLSNVYHIPEWAFNQATANPHPLKNNNNKKQTMTTKSIFKVNNMFTPLNDNMNLKIYIIIADTLIIAKSFLATFNK